MKRILLIISMLALVTQAACTSSPRYTRNGPSPRSSVTIEDETVTVTGHTVVKNAQSFLGTPYRYGGTSGSGMDCSGLVYTVYSDIGIVLPRTSHDQSSFGARIDRSKLQPGDLVFFRTGSSSRVTHVGIYAGQGEFIHASTRSKRVKFDRLDNKYFRKRFVLARRVL